MPASLTAFSMHEPAFQPALYSIPRQASWLACDELLLGTCLPSASSQHQQQVKRSGTEIGRRAGSVARRVWGLGVQCRWWKTAAPGSENAARGGSTGIDWKGGQNAGAEAGQTEEPEDIHVSRGQVVCVLRAW